MGGTVTHLPLTPLENRLAPSGGRGGGPPAPSLWRASSSLLCHKGRARRRALKSAPPQPMSSSRFPHPALHRPPCAGTNVTPRAVCRAVRTWMRRRECWIRCAHHVHHIFGRFGTGLGSLLCPPTSHQVCLGRAQPRPPPRTPSFPLTCLCLCGCLFFGFQHPLSSLHVPAETGGGRCPRHHPLPQHERATGGVRCPCAGVPELIGPGCCRGWPPMVFPPAHMRQLLLE